MIPAAWPNPMTNYRKSKAGEVKCRECVFYSRPLTAVGWGSRGRCGTGHPTSPTIAVGAGHTCDAAAKAKGDDA